MEVLSCIGLVFTVLILVNHYLHHYWTRRGFAQLKPKFLVGNIGDLFRFKKSIAEIYGEFYKQSKDLKIVGLYFLYRPALLVIDTCLIQNILVKDFQYFVNHGLYVDEKRDPLSGHLFSLQDEKWKNLRAKISPMFSPVKLKLMFPTFLDCAVNLQRHVKNCAQSDNKVIEIRDLLARYTTDIIASVAYGFDNDSINNPDNIFRKMGAKVFEPSFTAGMRALTTFLMPKTTKLLGIRTADRDVEDFMFTMVKETIEFRESHNKQRNDFMQMMIKLKNEGFIHQDEADNSNETSKLTIEEVVAQAFVFFIAAFETTSSTMALCLYELAKNEVLQKKVQKEIDEIFKAERSISKKVDFELMTEMKYLDCCLNETLRKYPPAPFLIRECGKLYHIPGSKVAIEKGTPVIISTFGLHRDPEFFPNPETFDPERFSDENVHLIKPFTFLPFGNGPRVCIGQRFGKLTAKLGLFLLLQKFNLKLEKEPQGELKFSPQQFVLTLEDEMRMNVSLRT